MFRKVCYSLLKHLVVTNIYIEIKFNNSMKLSKYLGRYVRIDLKNGFYYKGTVISVDDDSISIIDFNGKDVDILIDQIVLIREDVKWYSSQTTKDVIMK